MLQHDLKFYETRQHPTSKLPMMQEPYLYFWCICGAWRGSSVAIQYAKAAESFMNHLEEVGQARLSTTVDGDNPVSAFL